MKRTLGLLGLLAVASVGGACSDNANNANAPANNNTATRTAPVETKSIDPNLNGNTAPSNTGVVQDNNGNQNTAGVKPMNGNANAPNTNVNGNANTKGNVNHKPGKP